MTTFGSLATGYRSPQSYTCDGYRNYFEGLRVLDRAIDYLCDHGRGMEDAVDVLLRAYKDTEDAYSAQQGPE